MKLTALGTGTNRITKVRYPSCYLLENNDKKYLLEMGFHVSRRLIQHNIDFLDIEALFISHAHPDHFGDLLIYIFSITLDALRFPNRIPQKPLIIHGFQGLKEKFTTLIDTYQISNVMSKAKYEIVEHEDEKFVVDNLKIQTKVVEHLKTGLAFRFTDERDHNFTYSGDTLECGALKELAEDTEIALFEAGIPSYNFNSDEPKHEHMYPQEAARLAQAAGARKLILTHIYENMEPEADILETARENFSGPLEIAYDGKVIIG